LTTEKQVLVPDIGDAKDVGVVEVLVKPGQRINKEQSIVVLESEKAAMEIPAPFAGVVREICVAVGANVSKGSLLLIMDVDEAGAAVLPTLMLSTIDAPQPIVGNPATSLRPAVPRMASVPPPARTTKLPHATPSVRKFSRELGVDLTHVTGTGRSGRITREDVQLYVKHAMSVTAKASVGTGLVVAPLPDIDFSKFGDVTLQPLTKIQKVSSRNLHRSWVTIPHVTQFDEADITELEDFRKKSHASKTAGAPKLTLLSFFMKAVVVVLREMPKFNSSLDASGENLIMKQYFHIGIAVDTPNGLMVPVIRDVDLKGLHDLAKELADISERARARRLTMEEMQGASMTISSLGGIGGTAFTPIINPPEVAILGVSRSEIKPVYQDGTFVPRLMCPLSLSYDHRVIDGADAARFTTKLRSVLTDIREMLL
jgi:pyruvate dehydrogenase E2 component (dihydrolipoamide acetyltransferase)